MLSEVYSGLVHDFPGLNPVNSTLDSVRHLLIISSSQLCTVGSIIFSCFTSTSSMSAAFLFFSAAISFLCSSENGYTSVTFPFTFVGSTGSLYLLDMVPRPLVSSWCATWLELTRYGGVEVVGLLERFSLPCDCEVSVITSSPLFHHSVN